VAKDKSTVWTRLGGKEATLRAPRMVHRCRVKTPKARRRPAVRPLWARRHEENSGEDYQGYALGIIGAGLKKIPTRGRSRRGTVPEEPQGGYEYPLTDLVVGAETYARGGSVRRSRSVSE
jgi:hypothetical protein